MSTQCPYTAVAKAFGAFFEELKVQNFESLNILAKSPNTWRLSRPENPLFAWLLSSEGHEHSRESRKFRGRIPTKCDVDENYYKTRDAWPYERYLQVQSWKISQAWTTYAVLSRHFGKVLETKGVYIPRWRPVADWMEIFSGYIGKLRMSFWECFRLYPALVANICIIFCLFRLVESSCLWEFRMRWMKKYR